MSSYRLRTFSPGGVTETPGAAAPPSRVVMVPEEAHLAAVALAREEAWREGYLAAQAEVTEAFLEDRSRLTSDLVEALNDARLSNEAARRHVLASVAPTVLALCDAILPALAEQGLGAEVAARAERALLAVPDAALLLRCAPEMAPELEATLAQRGVAARVEAAPELLPREAELHWDEGFDRIDLEACMAAIRSCLASHLEPSRTGGDPEGDTT